MPPTSAPSSRWLSYEEASAWYQAEGITTQAELTARAKQGLPPGIPAAPRKAYPEEFKEGGLGRFLGTGRIAPCNREWVPYEEASTWYQAEGVTNQRELRARAKQGLPPGITSHPDRAYPEEFKDGGLGRFLGTGRVATFNREWVSYEEASAWYQDEGVTTQAALFSRAKQGLPPGIPANPSNAYREEFKNGGWGRFLGTGRIANCNREWVSYEEASAWYQAEGVTTDADLRARAKQGLPPGIPAKPNRAYAEEFKKGGIAAFLDLKKMNGASKIERALRHVLETLFKEPDAETGRLRVQGASGKVWHVDVALNRIRLIVEYDGARFHYTPKKISVDQRKTKDLTEAGWMVVRIRGQGSHRLPLIQPNLDLSLEEKLSTGNKISLVCAHLIKLHSEGRLTLSSSDRLRLLTWAPKDIESFNFRKLLAAYDGLASYEEASAWYQAEGVTTEAELNARAKQGLPPGIPADPRNAYLNEFRDGGLGRFLGTGRIAPSNREWVSYEEASAWYQAEGVTTQAELIARAKQGLPPGIPADPRNVYLNEFRNGGLGRFLGTGRIAPSNREWLSYEEASAWYQSEGVTTGPALTARAKQGLPPGIPSDPNRVYREEFKNGGLGRFLGTGRIAYCNREWVSYEEASAWYQAEGVTTQAELKARAKQGLPPGIPSHPDEAYPEEFKDGGLGRFLGTGRIANRNREWVSYEEASAWYQAERVTTIAELRTRAKQGLPPGIPSDPNRVYPEEFKDGGLRRFLGTGQFGTANTNDASARQTSLGERRTGAQEVGHHSTPQPIDPPCASPAPASQLRRRFR